jgi:Iml2/Tetratricopeptide repeat protein 39
MRKPQRKDNGNWLSRRIIPRGDMIRVGPSAVTLTTVGAEYTLCIAFALLMSAMVSFLSESVIESLRGAYKLRKSYQLLHKLYDMIVAVDGNCNEISGKNDALEGHDFVETLADFDAAVALSRSVETVAISEQRSERLSMTSSRGSTSHRRQFSITTISTFYDIPSHPLSGETTLADQTIYSGTLMALSTIMLLISLLPPSLSRLLSIIGFRGTRSQALHMLWKVAPQPSPFGALATFVLGAFYGNIVQNSDIVTEEYVSQTVGNAVGTLEKLHAAIIGVRKRYPTSALWVVEEVPIL